MYRYRRIYISKRTKQLMYMYVCRFYRLLLRGVKDSRGLS